MSDSDSDRSVASGEEEEVITDLSNSDVVAKYRLSAQIANQALQGVMTQCQPGKPVVDICVFGDAVIEGLVNKSFKSKKVEKGIAFPTCISVNECVCHFSPLRSEAADIVLSAGDMVKIDLGVHVDGFIAVAAHTIVVPAEGEATPELAESQSDVMVAAHTAAEAALRLIRPGNTNTQVTAAIKSVADTFGVTPLQGTLSHQMKQFVIDGNKVILQREETDQKVDECVFEENEVYSVDICFSTGEGKPRETGTRTTVFKRAIETNYLLKMKASRYVINEVNKRFPTLPFTIRALDERQGRLGVIECLKHNMLHSYPVLFEKEKAQVAHFKFTVLVQPHGTTKVTGLDLPEYITSEKSAALSDEIKSVLARSATVSKSKRKKKNKKKASAGAGGAAADGGAEGKGE